MPIGRMIVVFANGPTIESLINRVGNGCLEVAVKNTETQFVLGGGLSETNDLVKICRQDGIPAFPLPVGRAFHTSMYKVKVKQFNADSINLSSHVKFISSITGEKLGMFSC
jgi:acyl transferase domain-containing protein